MSSSITNSDDTRSFSLEGSQEKEGPVASKEEIESVVKEVMSSLEKGLSVEDLRLYAELQELHHFIEVAKSEIASIRPDDIQNEHIPQATDELSAVVEATEQATGAILDAAEVVENVAEQLSGEHQQKLQDVATAIYEASGFQDLTGQRITKVTSALKHIDEKITSLLVTFSNMGEDPSGSQKKASPQKEKEVKSTVPSDQDLLNGPQMPDQANDQDAIDALFDN